MSHDPVPPQQTGLLIVDLQNDFLHPEGAYGRANQGAEAIAALPARILPLAQRLRATGGWVIGGWATGAGSPCWRCSDQPVPAFAPTAGWTCRLERKSCGMKACGACPAPRWSAGM